MQRLYDYWNKNLNLVNITVADGLYDVQILQPLAEPFCVPGVTITMITLINFLLRGYENELYWKIF